MSGREESLTIRAPSSSGRETFGVIAAANVPSSVDDDDEDERELRPKRLTVTEELAREADTQIRSSLNFNRC